MLPLFTADQSRQIDCLLMERTPVSGYELMCRAANACFHALNERWSSLESVVILTGYGNNGGDGYLLGKLLLEAGVAVSVYQATETPVGDDAQRAQRDYLQADGVCKPLSELEKINADLVVDAIFGTGLSRPVPAEIAGLIENVNASSSPVLAVDVPSGLNADTGQTLPCAIEADLTVTFITRKQGLYTGEAKDVCGEIIYCDLQTDEQYFSDVTPSAYLTCIESVTPLKVRRRNVHKGDFGTVLIIGGDYGMAGAVCLAGIAALRCGAGKVHVATRPEHTATVVASCPALMAHEVQSPSDVKGLLADSDVIVIGPGLGRGVWSKTLFSEVLQSERVKVIDADALHLLAKEPYRSEDWVLTPHPGEARTLLDNAEAHLDRYAAVREIARRYGGVCVLKGAGTLVADSDLVHVCVAGNPGMATAGMGDVLSGVIAAWLAQGEKVLTAATRGVCVHARAGDRSAQDHGERGMTAADLMPYLRAEMN